MLDTLSRLSTRPTAPVQRTALAEYGRVSLEARVETASPHQLVVLLFDRLAQVVRDAKAGALSHDAARRLRATEKALAILDGLDATLDDERGGDVARSLHTVYALLRDRLLAGQPQGLGEALASIEDLAAAWRTIAPSGR